jgi:phosphoglycolate phosphatase
MQCYYVGKRDMVLDTNIGTLIVFDLDGTLVDSAFHIASATNQTRLKLGLAAASSRQLQHWFGNHPDKFFPELTGVERGFAVSSFRELLSDSLHLIKPAPGAHRLLEYLVSKEVKLAIATTKPSWLAQEVVKEVGMSNFFEHVQGSEGLNPKPSPEVFFAVEKALGVSPKIKFAIGDRVSDMKASVSAGYRSTLLSRWPLEIRDRDFTLTLATKYSRVSSLESYQRHLGIRLSKAVQS